MLVERLLYVMSARRPRPHIWSGWKDGDLGGINEIRSGEDELGVVRGLLGVVVGCGVEDNC